MALTDRLAADIGKLIDLVEAQAATIASHGTDLATAQAAAEAAQSAADAANATVKKLQDLFRSPPFRRSCPPKLIRLP